MSNPYYDHGLFPVSGSPLSSAAMRAELEAIEAGFEKLPVPTGNAGKVVVVNPSGTGLMAVDADVKVSDAIHAVDAKTTPADADELALADSAAAWSLKKLTWANLKLAIKNYYDSVTATLTNKTLTSPVINSPTGIVKGDVGLGNVDNTSDANKPVSTATQTALNLKANLASPTFTGTVGGITKTMVGLGNVDNTADSAKPVSTAMQTALNAKANLASPTFTGTVGGITKSMVGLGSVDNTADSAKPVSTAQQAALNLKADLTGVNFTGPITSSVAATTTDWNTTTTTGWFMGAGAANAPTATIWYIGQVVAHNSSWVTQELWAFSNNSDTDTQTYRRERNNGTWGAWVRLYRTAAEIGSVVPTLSGSGATGTWNISITGNAATVSNGVYTNVDQAITAPKRFDCANTGMSTSDGGRAPLEARGTGGAAFMSFHRPSAYAAYFGIDSDNQWKVGGWSMGAVSYKIWHAGNDGSGSGLDADLVRGAFPSASVVGSSLAQRTADGYLFGNYFNMTADNQTAAPTRVAIETGSDGFLRWQSLSQFTLNLRMVDPVWVVSSSTTASLGYTHVLTASLTLTLPSSPGAGWRVGIVNRSGTTTCVIARNGQNIMGLAENMTLDNINASLTLIFADATRGWVWA